MTFSKAHPGFVFLVLAALLVSQGALAEGLPNYVGFLSNKVALRAPEYQEWDEARIPPYGDPTPDALRHGKHWHVFGHIKAGGSDRAAAW